MTKPITHLIKSNICTYKNRGNIGSVVSLVSANATGMEITKTGVKLSYKRILVGTDGSVPSKYTYQAKWHFFPIPAAEVARLNALTGEKWQNKGW